MKMPICAVAAWIAALLVAWAAADAAPTGGGLLLRGENASVVFEGDGESVALDAAMIRGVLGSLAEMTATLAALKAAQAETAARAGAVGREVDVLRGAMANASTAGDQAIASMEQDIASMTNVLGSLNTTITALWAAVAAAHPLPSASSTPSRSPSASPTASPSVYAEPVRA